MTVYRRPAKWMRILVKKYLRNNVDNGVVINGEFIRNGKFRGELAKEIMVGFFFGNDL